MVLVRIGADDTHKGDADVDDNGDDDAVVDKSNTEARKSTVTIVMLVTMIAVRVMVVMLRVIRRMRVMLLG